MRDIRITTQIARRAGGCERYLGLEAGRNVNDVKVGDLVLHAPMRGCKLWSAEEVLGS